MSIESWKKEFYKQEASVDIRYHGQHVERKWIGLLPKNLKKHGLNKNTSYDYIYDKTYEKLNIDDSSCCWCLMSNIYGSNACDNCPAVKVGMPECDENPDSPYMKWKYNNEISPMLKWIREARRRINKKGKKS